MTLPNILSTVRCILSVPHIHVQIQECKDLSKDLTILQYKYFNKTKYSWINSCTMSWYNLHSWKGCFGNNLYIFHTTSKGFIFIAGIREQFKRHLKLKQKWINFDITKSGVIEKHTEKFIQINALQRGRKFRLASLWSLWLGFWR